MRKLVRTGVATGTGLMLLGLLATAPVEVAHVSTDGAYDTVACDDAIAQRGARPVIAPDKNVVDHATDGARDHTVRRVHEIGRKAWKVERGDHRRSFAETAMFRMKLLVGRHLSAHSLANQQTEAAIRGRAPNRITRPGMPDLYPVQDRTA